MGPLKCYPVVVNLASVRELGSGGGGREVREGGEGGREGGR